MSYEEIKELALEKRIQMPLRSVISESRVMEDVLAKTVLLGKSGKQVWVPWLPREIASNLIEEGHRSLSKIVLLCK